MKKFVSVVMLFVFAALNASPLEAALIDREKQKQNRKKELQRVFDRATREGRAPASGLFVRAYDRNQDGWIDGPELTAIESFLAA